MLEYALVAGLIAMVAIVAVSQLGGSLSNSLDNSANSVTDALGSEG